MSDKFNFAMRLAGWWWPRAESNHRHEDFQSSALPTELLGHFFGGTIILEKFSI